MMSQEENQMLETGGKFSRYHRLLKLTLQFLVPASLLSIFLSYSSGYSFFHSYNFHLSTFVFPVLSPTLERKYMFLICNGIIAFLAKNLSCSISSATSSDLNGELGKSYECGEKPVPELSQTKQAPLEGNQADTESTIKSLENVAHVVEKEAEEPEHGPLNTELEGRESEVIVAERDDSEGEGDEETEEGVALIGAASPPGDGNEANFSTDELNRKVEEFIRKMKEEIRIEAQQQLIAV